MWSYATASGSVYSIDVADINNDEDLEIAVGTSGDDVFIMHHDGSQYVNWTLGMGNVEQLLFGNFTGGNQTLLAMVTGSSVSVMNPVNGTVVYQTPSSSVAAGPNLRAADFNDDGIDDIVYARLGLHVLDLTTRTVFYNSTEFDSSWYILDVWVYDFDGDGTLEIGCFNSQGNVFLEDVSGGITQWTYSAKDPYATYDVEIGNYGGSGEMDFVVGLLNSSSSVMIALDGKNGIPMWFNRTGGWIYQVGSIDIHGTGVDTALMWDLSSHEIIGVDSYERVYPEVPDAYASHGIYWESEFNTSIKGTAVADFNGDGIDEIVVWHNVTIALMNGTNGATFWSRDLSESVGQVDIGDMDGSGWLDIVFFDKNYTFHVLSGNTGLEIGELKAPGSFIPNDFYVEDFSGTYDNEELAILWQAPIGVYIGWYNHDGSLHYKSSSNISGTVYQMAVGDILGDGRSDVIIGGHNEYAAVYRGSDGQFQFLHDLTPFTIYDIIVGNYTGDSKADFALMDSSYDLHIIDGSTNLQTGFLNFVVKIDEVHAADMDNDGRDEIVVNAEKVGINAFSHTGALDWDFWARLLVSSFDWDLAFADMDGDGHTDLIMTNHEYINVVSGATERLLWHHVGNDRHVKAKVGRFIDPTYPPDILSYRYERLYIVSGTNPVPEAPPIPPALLHAQFNLADMVMQTASVGIPIGILLLVPVLVFWWRRKRPQ
jgi:hypothetical protein